MFIIIIIIVIIIAVFADPSGRAVYAGIAVSRLQEIRVRIPPALRNSVSYE